MHLHASTGGRRPGASDGVDVELADGRVLARRCRLLAQGHLDAHATAAERDVRGGAADAGLTYLPTGYTADLDLSPLEPGRGRARPRRGLAFIDLMVLLTSGRGGRFERRRTAGLRYRPSGAEPVLHVGSRRGVPYRAKLGYVWAGPPVPLRFFTPRGDRRASSGTGRSTCAPTSPR